MAKRKEGDDESNIQARWVSLRGAEFFDPFRRKRAGRKGREDSIDSLHGRGLRLRGFRGFLAYGGEPRMGQDSGLA